MGIFGQHHTVMRYRFIQNDAVQKQWRMRGAGISQDGFL